MTNLSNYWISSIFITLRKKTWYLKNAKPINLKYTQHILHTTCKFRNMISPKYDKVKTNNFRLEFHGGILLFPRVKGHKKCSWKISQQNLFVFILYHSFINSSHWILCVFFLSASPIFVSVSLVRENWRGWEKIEKYKIQALLEFIKLWYKMKTNKFCWEIFHEHFFMTFHSRKQ